MRLFQIDAGKTITITAKNDKGLSASYKTETAFGMNDMLFAKPVRRDGVALDFSGKDIEVSVTYATEDGKVLEWRKCAAKNARYEKEVYTVLYAAGDARKVNRRNSYRQFLAYDGVLHFGKNGKEAEVTVRDISVMGVGIIMEEELALKELGLLNLEYKDEELDMPVQLYANPVRIERIDDNHTAYGCRIVQSETNLGRYIAAKQKNEASRMHGTNFNPGKRADHDDKKKDPSS